MHANSRDRYPTQHANPRPVPDAAGIGTFMDATGCPLSELRLPRALNQWR
jgi:hypothetical protein